MRLDLSNLPTFEKTSIFCNLDTTTEIELKEFPNVFQRATAAMRFCQYMGGGIVVNDNDRDLMRVACLRASLMEFAGMEEVLPLDLSQRGNSDEAFKIFETGNVLLILLKELRNLQLHLINTSFTREDREAVSYSSIIEPRYTSFPIHMIPMDDLLQLKNLKNAPKYDESQLKTAIEWLNDAQRHWGIRDVLQTGVESYARLIVETYR